MANITIIKKAAMENMTQLKVQARDEDTGFTQEFRFSHTWHSLERASRRGIDARTLETVLTYGEEVHKQGLVFCIMGKNQVPERMSKDRDKLVNTVVVLDGTSETILTCYRSSNPHRHIRKKSKRLARYDIAA